MLNHEIDEDIVDELCVFDDEDLEDEDEDDHDGVTEGSSPQRVADENESAGLRCQVDRDSHNRERRRRRRGRRGLVPRSVEVSDKPSPPDDKRIERFRTLCTLERRTAAETGELLQLCRDVGCYLTSADVVAFAAKQSTHRRHGSS